MGLLQSVRWYLQSRLNSVSTSLNLCGLMGRCLVECTVGMSGFQRKSTGVHLIPSQLCGTKVFTAVFFM